MRRHNQAQRMIALPPYPFARWNKEIARVRAEGVDVIRLDIGNPDLPPPDSERFQLVEGPRFLGPRPFATPRVTFQWGFGCICPAESKYIIEVKEKSYASIWAHLCRRLQ
jgi:hypothetical protein